MDIINEVTANGLQIIIPTVIGSIRYLRTIGRGSFGIVYEGYCMKRDKNFACKIVSRDNLVKYGDFAAFEREVRAHEQIHHPNIIEIHEVLYHPDVIVLVMDLCKTGDLLHFVLSHQYPQICLIRQMFYQIVKAIDYLHQRGIAHRDLKPDNILLDDFFNIKLADFGCAQLGIGNSNTKNNDSELCGTLFYAAPEILKSGGYDSRKADIWSLGIVLFAMTCGQLPWTSQNESEVKELIVTGNVQFPKDFPEDVYSIVKKCTKLNPDERPTAQEILDLQWFEWEKQKIEMRLNRNKKVEIVNPINEKITSKRPIIIRPQASSQIFSINSQGASLPTFVNFKPATIMSSKRIRQVVSTSCPPAMIAAACKATNSVLF
ncbi:CAMK family protein kinase [Tritrichomonas foetus]|uniref:CAMK family protein kinase n=1 Tax=Tritrichomonas foetus TaxID=1144522 RepID=A0A1J4K347_9EUKA|nr:CAMK family protein kinase [Tritrichomonas foetus]|eukprot:OHT05394.1 CAMK family protein kinase [Tritrichomonas foetus]